MTQEPLVGLQGLSLLASLRSSLPSAAERISLAQRGSALDPHLLDHGDGAQIARPPSAFSVLQKHVSYVTYHGNRPFLMCLICEGPQQCQRAAQTSSLPHPRGGALGWRPWRPKPLYSGKGLGCDLLGFRHTNPPSTLCT